MTHYNTSCGIGECEPEESSLRCVRGASDGGRGVALVPDE
ncbi:hypothetical protein B4135_0591 [Caldibacillus debilis]|uniref:Uncharacterized protein n=1 Tax=Caldibacillus debilis TaxID=301148 RepID=A0A150MA94_9BACI|nr:hypothetical protein B4135_0591 [Caldibacillus debilis]